ncbi:MAG: hypothetical protein JSC161_000444 [Candidatus Tokpelaia sp. JSC161]|jgi:hypothetical protein|nr:MAG: hypothetical protein JSC161_000444 [Candidatus Tokpelaia sp. JSC161]
MDICSFWYGRTLRMVDRICLSSMVKTGQRVKLFVYEPIDNLPKGVELHDAESILSKAWFAHFDPEFSSLNQNVSLLQFSDFFRVMLMKYSQGGWLDTDVYLLKPFSPDVGEVWLARENRFRVGVSALYFPPNNPIISAFEAYMEGDNPVPDWLGFKRRVIRPALLRIRGMSVHPKRIGITVFGNDGISRLAKRFGFFDKAKSKKTFYYWTGRKAERIFDPWYGLEVLSCPELIGFHIHRKLQTHQVPRCGSFYEWACRRLGENEIYNL